MRQYLDLLRLIRTEGVRKSDRTGTGTLSVFAQQLRFDLAQGFPLVTTKNVHLRSVVYELLWFLRGETNIAWLHEHDVSIWDEWADAGGELGPVYGKQWRAWRTADGDTIDQIANAVQLLKTNPDSRRIIVSAWNVGELGRMSLMPCHAFFQLYVAGGRLSAAHAHVRAAVRPGTGRIHLDRRRLPSVPESPRAGGPAAQSHAVPAAAVAHPAAPGEHV